MMMPNTKAYAEQIILKISEQKLSLRNFIKKKENQSIFETKHDYIFFSSSGARFLRSKSHQQVKTQLQMLIDRIAHFYQSKLYISYFLRNSLFSRAAWSLKTDSQSDSILKTKNSTPF